MIEPIRRKGAATLLVTLALVVGTGCASKARPTSTPSVTTDAGASVTSFPQVNDWRQYVRPVDFYLPTADNAVSLQGMAYIAEAKCLGKKGYPHSASDLEPANLPAYIRLTIHDQVVRSDLYGFFDTDNVAKYGYTRPPGEPGPVMLRTPPGVPTDIASACRSQGQALAGPAASGVLPNGGPIVASDDPRVVAATKSWVTCMSNLGIKVSSPIQAESDHQSTSASDIAIAKADISCKQKTNLVGVSLGVQTELDNKYISENKDAVTSYKANLQALLAQSAAG